MESAFSNIKALGDITGLAGWDTGKVTDMDSMFYGCKALTDLDAILGWKTGSVRDMSHMFMIKLIGKMLLLPVTLLIGILRLLMKAFVELSSCILGILLLFVFGCIIFTLVRRTWDSMMILIVTETALVLVTFGIGVIQYWLDAAALRLKSLQKLYMLPYDSPRPSTDAAFRKSAILSFAMTPSLYSITASDFTHGLRSRSRGIHPGRRTYRSRPHRCGSPL